MRCSSEIQSRRSGCGTRPQSPVGVFFRRDAVYYKIAGRISVKPAYDVQKRRLPQPDGPSTDTNSLFPNDILTLLSARPWCLRQCNPLLCFSVQAFAVISPLDNSFNCSPKQRYTYVDDCSLISENRCYRAAVVCFICFFRRRIRSPRRPAHRQKRSSPGCVSVASRSRIILRRNVYCSAIFQALSWQPSTSSVAKRDMPCIFRQYRIRFRVEQLKLYFAFTISIHNSHTARLSPACCFRTAEAV